MIAVFQRTEQTRILLVDDEADILDAVSTFLETELDGVAVIVALDARQALDLLRDHDIAAVVSDLRMPGMDGIQFLTEVRRRDPGMPTILMTAYADPEAERAAREDAHVRSFIPKPPDLDRLVATLRELVAEGHSRRRPPRPSS